MYLTTNAAEEAKEYTPRYRLFQFVILTVAGIIFLRLWYLQIISGDELKFFSEKNHIKASKIMAPRGMLLDRDGRVLVENTAGFEVTITPQYAKKLTQTSEAVGKILGIPGEKIKHDVLASARKDGNYLPFRIKDNLTMDEVARLEPLKIDHPGLDINMVTRRSYLGGSNGAQLFGYVGEISKTELPRYNKDLLEKDQFQKGDWVGKSGVELAFDRHVRGVDGVNMVQVDALGREAQIQTSTLFGEFKQIDPVAGNNIQLTIDKDIQDALFKAFRHDDTGEDAGLGAAVALDPKSGEVLAWVSAPAFNPNDFATGISSKLWSSLINDVHRPLRNKVIQDHSPPGSTFKPLVALAALQEKVVTPQTTFFCTGQLPFGRRVYHCHLKKGHGSVNMYAAIEQSCDIYFYKLGLALGIDKIAKYTKALGIGVKTGINIRNEVSGLMPTEEWKLKTTGEEWQAGENLSNAIGQGFVLTTPLQLALAYSTVANEGPYYRPHLVKRLLDNENKVIEEYEPELIHDISKEGNSSGAVISKETFKVVKEGLRLVSNGDRGTAKRYNLPYIEMAGKTGTVQLFTLNQDEVFKKCENRPLLQRHHGWFVGYAPADDPKIVIAVWAEHACHGSTAAAPIVRKGVKAYVAKYMPQLLKDEKKLKTKTSTSFVEE